MRRTVTMLKDACTAYGLVAAGDVLAGGQRDLAALVAVGLAEWTEEEEPVVESAGTDADETWETEPWPTKF
jgi:hypothetical protein